MGGTKIRNPSFNQIFPKLADFGNIASQFIHLILSRIRGTRGVHREGSSQDPCRFGFRFVVLLCHRLMNEISQRSDHARTMSLDQPFCNLGGDNFMIFSHSCASYSSEMTALNCLSFSHSK